MFKFHNKLETIKNIRGLKDFYKNKQTKQKLNKKKKT